MRRLKKVLLAKEATPPTHCRQLLLVSLPDKRIDCLNRRIVHLLLADYRGNICGHLDMRRNVQLSQIDDGMTHVKREIRRKAGGWLLASAASCRQTRAPFVKHPLIPERKDRSVAVSRFHPRGKRKRPRLRCRVQLQVNV